MQRRQLLSSAVALAGAVGLPAAARASAPDSAAVPDRGKPLQAPAKGYIKVAFVIGPQLVAIDLIGPFTVFGSADGFTDRSQGFDVYSVSASTQPYDIGDLFVGAKYTFDDA
jgi:hypothetical protein